MSDRVEVAQHLHHGLAYLVAGNLWFTRGHELLLYLTNRPLHLLWGDRSFPAGKRNPMEDLVSREGLSPSVLLEDPG